jgi:uncharacterized protein YqfA (UPF0365 family)
MDQIVFGSTIFIIFFAILVLVILVRFIPVGLWIQAQFSGVRISFPYLFGMRFRKVNPARIVNPLITATKAGLHISADDLEGHLLAGGNVERVVQALIAADKANIKLPFRAGGSRSTWRGATYWTRCKPPSTRR